MELEPIIGLEVHIELKTLSKMFCGCPADYFGKEPNTQTCPVCLGLPGALPVPNKKAIEWTIVLSQALECRVNSNSKFDRKNYFYADLPKGYQISQYDEPIATGGNLKFNVQNPQGGNGIEKLVRIRRVHLEEDTGKLIHSQVNGEDSTLVDFNRSGVPLVEIVTEPDLRSSDEAKAFLKEIQKIVRYLQISDADMEKGTMRIEPSISLKQLTVENGQLSNDGKLPDYRVEIKNINSFRFAQKAIDYEIGRQTELLLKSEKIEQQTRGWDEAHSVTVYQRSKEEAHDYRYFPEPDIPPLYFSPEFIGALPPLPELPWAKSSRFVENYKIRQSEADLLCEDRGESDFFEQLVTVSQGRDLSPQKIANLLINKKVQRKGRPAQEVLEEILASHTSDFDVISEVIVEVSRGVVSNNQGVINDYKNGKEKALDFLVGQVLRNLKEKGRADPNLVRQKLRELINHG